MDIFRLRLSDLVGRGDVILRFAEVDNQEVFHTGADDVVLGNAF